MLVLALDLMSPPERSLDRKVWSQGRCAENPRACKSDVVLVNVGSHGSW